MTHVLTFDQFEALWSELRLGSTPYPIDVHGAGKTVDERERLRREALAQLQDTRYDVEPLLRLLDQHVVAVDLVSEASGPVRALAASDERYAVLAVVAGNRVELTPIRPTALSSAVLGVLPDRDAGAGHALSVPVDAMHRAASLMNNDDDADGDLPWGLGAELDERTAFGKAGLSAVDATLMSELTTSRIAGGQFGVTVHGRRAQHVVTWFDTPRGRYLMVKDGGWLSIAPADFARMTARIDSLLTLTAA